MGTICIKSSDISVNNNNEPTTNNYINSHKLNEIIDKLIPEGCLFCDNEFLADNTSIWYNGYDIKNETDIVWKRAKDLVKRPFLIQNDISKEDIIQGNLANCWFLVAAAAISQRKDLIEKLIPLNQPLFGLNYHGIIICKFWQFGEQIEILIDDFLPTKNNSLIYAKCENKNEFWISFLEKAYCKMNGCYEALEGGNSTDALIDLTGGIAELYEIEMFKNDINQLFDNLLKAYQDNAFMTCSVHAEGNLTNVVNSYGLVGNHAYTIKSVYQVTNVENKESINLIKIRNPWKNSVEWKGKWNDDDSDWSRLISQNDRNKINFKPKADDGEFFMSFEDFCKHFKDISVCRLTPDFHNKSVNSNYYKTINGQWIGNQNAGGCRNNFELFATNPQYLIYFDKIKHEQTKFNSIISLMQDYRKSLRNNYDKKLLQIGYFIYKIKEESSVEGQIVDKKKKLTAKYLSENTEYEKSGVFVDYREVTKRIDFSHGYYVIIPCTFLPNQVSKFVLRIYSEVNFNIE